jgi:hypothetical protein
MRCLQWDEFQHENSNTWENVRMCEMSSRSNQKREERWFRVFVKSVQWSKFAMFIFSLITFLHRWEIADCARTCLDELSSSERLSIQILQARRKFHAKHNQNNTSFSLFIVRIASFNIEIRISIDERKRRAASFRANLSSSTQARRNLIEIFMKHHSDYKTIEFDSNRLTQMSKDESIWNKLFCINDSISKKDRVVLNTNMHKRVTSFLLCVNANQNKWYRRWNFNHRNSLCFEHNQWIYWIRSFAESFLWVENEWRRRRRFSFCFFNDVRRVCFIEWAQHSSSHRSNDIFDVFFSRRSLIQQFENAHHFLNRL